MYTATIGKRLIRALNERDGTAHTPETFFDEVYYPLFFRNERFLFNANNSPVDQAYKSKAKRPLTPEVLDEQRLVIHSKIGSGQKDASIYMGGASTDIHATTSGQVTALQFPAAADDVYASWIGAGLGVTIEGGLSLLIDDPAVLLAIYEGWYEYRALLDQTPQLKANQVNTWNGQWVSYRLGENHIAGQKYPPAFDKDGGVLVTAPWVRLIFSLCWTFHKTPDKAINAYVYSFGQMNRTGGFIRLNLPGVRRLSDLFDSLFTVPDGLPSKNFEDLYQTELSFMRAFQCGEIGLRALQPKDLRGLLSGSKEPKYSASDAQKSFLFDIQQLWIIAMLNNKELIDKAEELAAILRGHAGQDQRLKKVNETQAKEVLASKSRRDFIENLTNIIGSGGGANSEAINALVTEIMGLPAENIPLFLTLLRFKYAYLESKPAAATVK